MSVDQRSTTKQSNGVDRWIESALADDFRHAVLDHLAAHLVLPDGPDTGKELKAAEQAIENAVTALLQASISDARSEALEEAAKVAEDEPEMDDDVPLSVLQLIHAHPVTASKAAVSTTKRSIASAIRALKDGAKP